MTDSTIIKELVTKMVFRLDHKSLTAYTKKVADVKRSLKELEALARKTIKPKIDTRSFRVATNEVGRLRQGIAQVARSAGRGITLKMNVSGMGSIMQAQRAAQRATSSGGMLNVAGGNLISGAVTEAGQMAQRVGKGVFDAVGEKQLGMIRLTKMLGAQGALSKYSELQKFGEITPYETPDLLNIFNAVKGSGYGLSMTDLTEIGDLSAGSGFKDLNMLREAIKSANRGLASMVDNFDTIRAEANDGVLTYFIKDLKTGKDIVKEVKAGDMQGHIAAFALAGKMNFGGSMNEMSKTLPGRQSTLMDKVKTRMVDMGDAGMTQVFGQAIERLIVLTDKAGVFIKQNGPAISDGFKLIMDSAVALAPLIKPIAVGVGVFAMHFAGLKVIAGGKWLWGAIKALWSLKWLAGGVPLAIGTVIAGIAAFGFEVYRYMTGGTKAISGFSKQFPALSHAIVWVGNKFKELWPLVQEVGAEFVKFGAQLWETFGPAVKWVFGNIVVPWLTWGIKKFIEFGEIILKAAKFWLPVLTDTVGDLGAGFKVCWERIQDTWTVLKDLWSWFTSSGMGQGLGNFFERLKNIFTGGGDSGGDGGALSSAMSQYGGGFGGQLAQFAKAQAMAMGGFTSLGKCAFGVETALSKLGVNFTGHAFQLKEQLDRNKRFKRVDVSDAEMRTLPPGTITVHDRNPVNAAMGKGALYGHVEVSLGNGQAASDYIGKQMEHHYAGGKRYVYIPVGTQTMQGPAGAGGGGGINQTNYFDLRGNPNPGANRNAARQGASEAVKQMERSARSTNQTVIAQ